MKELPALNKNMVSKPSRSIKILQFGEGNFLRAFCDYYVQYLNEQGDFNGNIAIIKPTSRGNLEKFQRQDNLYTVEFLGIKDGKPHYTDHIVNSIELSLSPYDDFDSFLALASEPDLKFIISNTTEAGIVYSETDQFSDRPQDSFPGKLTRFLYERFCIAQTRNLEKLIILPCELIDNNADELKAVIKKHSKAWGLGEAFASWLETECLFVNTLVDKIVSGRPEDAEKIESRLGYSDQLLVQAEDFGLWVIEDSSEQVKSAFGPAVDNLPFTFTADCSPYKTRKVRILNGAHTTLAAAALLAGKTYVNEAMEDRIISSYLEGVIYKEILPGLKGLVDDPEGFAKDVLLRFRNPEIKHALKSICLNTVSKWKTRCLPSVTRYYELTSKLPKGLLFSLAAIKKYCEEDSQDESLHLLDQLLNQTLSEVPEAINVVEDYYAQIHRDGAYATIESVQKELWNE